MKVSVIIPSHNAASYLPQTIGSVLDQSLAVSEIIVVNDGSSDDTLSIARQFEAVCGDRLRVYSEHSGGQARTNNLGASVATGDALMFLDADDVLGPDAIEALAAALASRSGAVAACPWLRLDSLDGIWVSRAASCSPRRPDQDALSAWLTGWYYPPCSVLWSREAFARSGGWNEAGRINTDGDVVMRALVNGVPLVETRAGTSYYRRMPRGTVSQSGKRFTYEGFAGRLAVIEKIARMIEEQGRLDTYRPSISHAFSLIEKDARARYAGLCQYARDQARRYSPPLWTRAASVVSRGEGGVAAERPTAALPSDRHEEVRHGLRRAESALAASETAPQPCAPAPIPSECLPAVTVIIPVYNRAHLLARALDSVLLQSFADFEVLVIDDCSQDDPESVVRGYNDSRLRYLRQVKNGGVAAARNRGLSEARAPFVAFLDDDDEWFPEKLRLQVELFRTLPADVGLIYTGAETISAGNKRSLQVPSARGDIYRELLVKNILHACPSSGMMRRDVIANVGFFDETLPAIEDYDYWLRVCRHYKVECLHEPLVRYNDYSEVPLTEDSAVRRSSNINANREARDQFYRKHGAQMRRAGLAHLFLLDSARRRLTYEPEDVSGSALRALKAFFLAPTAWEVRCFGSELLRRKQWWRFNGKSDKVGGSMGEKEKC